MNTAFTFTAAAMPDTQARILVNLFCKEADLPSEERVRRRLKRRFKAGLMRVFNFAKHETLRKMHRYMHSNRALMGQEHPGTVRIVFNPRELRSDLQALLYSELPQMLGSVAVATLESVGFRDPWTMPAQDVLDFIARRENLLSGVPDEIFETIREAVTAGLNAGEPMRELSDRITQAFTEIEDGRADVIAETETAAAYGFAGHKSAVAAGVRYKKWLHSVIPKVPRPDHIAIHGLIVPIDEPYPVGTPPLMYPHAPDGSPEDIINCRCLSIPVSEADYRAQAK